MLTRFPHHRPELSRSLPAGDEQLKEWMRASRQTVPAGTTLIHDGANNNYIYRLVSGWACRKRRVPDGREQIILLYLPGELFAVKSLFLSSQFDEIQALTNAVVERIHYLDLQQLCATSEDVSRRCMWQVIEEECRLHVWVFALGRASAEERFAWALLDFRARLILSGAITPDALTYPMPLTQAELACYLGITPVHVNRVLRRFRIQGIVNLRRDEVVIHQLQWLQDIAEPLQVDREERAAECISA